MSVSDPPVCSGNKDSEKCFAYMLSTGFGQISLKKLELTQHTLLNYLNSLKFKILVSNVLLGRELLLLIDFLSFFFGP